MSEEPNRSGADVASAYAADLARRIVQKQVEPSEGMKALAATWSTLVPLEEALRVFVGLADQWDELPELRAEMEQEIVVQADRFLARFGR